MTSYTISKYNPQLRGSKHVCELDEWTSVSDVGRVFDGERFEFSQYSLTEENYLNFATHMLQNSNVLKLDICRDAQEITGSEPSGWQLVNFDQTKFKRVFDRGWVDGIEEAKLMIQAILREITWSVLESENLSFDFGYDYFMGVRTNESFSYVKELASEYNLFAEEGWAFRSN